MDQPREQSVNSSRPAQRDMMYCHECMDEWYRDEHGLACPECGSDFTEVVCFSSEFSSTYTPALPARGWHRLINLDREQIEDDNDPRDFTHDEGGDDDESMHSDDDGPPHFHPHHHHHPNPWASDDPEEGDISNVQFTRVGPSQFNVQATFTRSITPGGMATGGFGPGSINGFMSMLNGLAGHAAARAQQQQQQERQNSEQGGQNNEEGQQNNTQGDQPNVRTSRFTYHGGIRLHPRDLNNPEPRVEPVDDLTNVLAGLIAAIGAPPGHTVHMHHHDHDHDHEHRAGDENQPEISPILQLFTSLGLIPGGQFGDAVYSQEALDRIVSQLMEQTATSNAPGPASQNDIDSLPRKHVDEAMLGAEGRAECSICMDEVNIGEEVSELPCKHWFHHQCVAAWLGEHDTCPHCRKGITKPSETESGDSTGGQAASGTGASTSMPGAFVSGEGSPTNPFVVPGDLGATNPHAHAPTSNNAENSTQNNGNGLGERFRRGLFGP